MLKARERQPEVVEPVIERLTRDLDTEPTHVGEVGQAHPPRRVLLAEDHISVGTVESPPSGKPIGANLGLPVVHRRRGGSASRTRVL